MRNLFSLALLCLGCYLLTLCLVQMGCTQGGEEQFKKDSHLSEHKNDIVPTSKHKNLFIKVDGYRLDVYPKDLSAVYKYLDAANQACHALGNGWRTPTQKELKALYTELHLEGNGSFEIDNYWSSSNFIMNFTNGEVLLGSIRGGLSSYRARVHPVRAY